MDTQAGTHRLLAGLLAKGVACRCSCIGMGGLVGPFFVRESYGEPL